MSATNRGGTRNEADFYPTPAWCVHRLLETVSLPGGVWLEPAAGDGALIRAVNQKRSDIQWAAMDIRPEMEDPCRAAGADFMTADFPALQYQGDRFAVAITNPPYSLAQEFIEQGLQVAETVIMLLRLNYLAGGKRADFMRAMPPDVYVLPNRPSFTGGGTDATEYAWFIWKPVSRSYGNLRVLPVTSKHER